MIVLKKINNNVAVCKDSNQRELIAFGKGIGFPPTPYELTDLKKIDRTFYNVSEQYISLLNDIPYEVIRFTAEQMLWVQDLKRMFEHKHIDSSNLSMCSSVWEEYPEIAECVERICSYYKKDWELELCEEEKLYLILHINRVCSKETI